MFEYILALLLYCDMTPTKCSVQQVATNEITLYVCDVPRDILTPKIQFMLVDEFDPLENTKVTVKIQCTEA